MPESADRRGGEAHHPAGWIPPLRLSPADLTTRVIAESPILVFGRMGILSRQRFNGECLYTFAAVTQRLECVQVPFKGETMHRVEKLVSVHEKVLFS